MTPSAMPTRTNTISLVSWIKKASEGNFEAIIRLRGQKSAPLSIDPMKITDHARQRGEERLGLSVEPFLRLAAKALDHGIKHGETSGRLKKYMDSLFMYKMTANNIRIYGEFIYLFCNQTLITVYGLPNEFKPVISKLKIRKLKT